MESAFRNWDGAYVNLPGATLNPSDFQKLRSRAIPHELAERALLRRVSSLEGGALVGRDGAGDYSGIAIPYIWPGENAVREYRLRRDKPDLELDAEGSTRERQKYLSPPGRGSLLYFVPGTPVEWLTNITLPLAVTEGEFKAMALWILARYGPDDAANQPRFCPAAIPGVWNWRGITGKAPGPDGDRRDIKGPIPDLARLAWDKRLVYVIFDSNVRTKRELQTARDQFADELARRGATVQYVEVPDVEGVNGIDDLVGLWGADRVLQLFATAKSPRITKRGERLESQATQLIRLAQERCRFYHTPDQVPFISLECAGHQETWRVQSSGFRSWLLHEYFARERKSPGAQAVGEAIDTVRSIAQFEGQQRQLCIRIAQVEDRVYVDLCDEKWRVIEISSAGWRVIESSPVSFRRTKGMLPLPPPVPGSLLAFEPLLNVQDEDWALCLSWLTGAFRGSGPYPILALTGEHGAAKTFTTKMLRSLIDPSVVCVRSMPRDERDLAIAASNGRCLAFDNISTLMPWQSDALCRISTGSGFGARKLFSDGEEALFQFCLPIILNGIESVTERADLADRAIVLELQPIPEAKRRLESELWNEYERLQPSILGGLCDGITAALHGAKEVKLDELPRMADFAVWAVAAESALGLLPGEFLRAYRGNRQSIGELTLEGDATAGGLRTFMNERREWVGSPTKLLEELEAVVDERVRGSQRWPGNAQALSGRLKRAAPFLRAAGIDVSWAKGTGGRRIVTVRKPAENFATRAPCASAER